MKSFFVLLAVLCLPAFAHGQNISDLRAGVLVNPPFVKTMTEGTYGGYAIELWERVASEQGWKCHYVPFHDITSLLKAAHEGKIDIAVGDLSITSDRWKQVDFTHPYYDSGLQVMINEDRKSSNSLARLWKGLRDNGHLELFAIGAAIVLLATGILTFFDRKWDPDFHKEWHHGLAESFFHVMSVVFTGKTTHKGLPDPFGKIIAGIWVGCGVAIVAFITSSVTSVMTTNALRSVISGPKDLGGKLVGTVSGSTSEKYVRAAQLDGEFFHNLPDAVNALVKGQINAIVYDAPILQFYDNAHPELPITEVGTKFDKQEYGFALPSGSSLRVAINEELLRLREAGFTSELDIRYFGFTQ